VTPIIRKHTLKFHTYFEGDDREVLQRFSQGKLDCLITCHRLSEGIDVRSLRNVILLSADRARLETIQRIGRCLRADPNHPNKRATVVDFVRISDSDDNQETADTRRRDWLIEVSRAELEEN